MIYEYYNRLDQLAKQKREITKNGNSTLVASESHRNDFVMDIITRYIVENHPDETVGDNDIFRFVLKRDDILTLLYEHVTNVVRGTLDIVKNPVSFVPPFSPLHHMIDSVTKDPIGAIQAGIESILNTQYEDHVEYFDKIVVMKLHDDIYMIEITMAESFGTDLK